MFFDVLLEELFLYVVRIFVFICVLKELLFMFVFRDMFIVKCMKMFDGIVMMELEINCFVGEGFIRVEVFVLFVEKIEILFEIFSWFEVVVVMFNDVIVSVSEFCMFCEVKVKFCGVFSLEEVCVNEVFWFVSDDFNICGLVVIIKNLFERFFLEEGVVDIFIDVIVVYFEVCDVVKCVVCVGGIFWKEILSVGVVFDCFIEFLVVLIGFFLFERFEIVVLEVEDSVVKFVIRKLLNVWICEDFIDVLISVNCLVCDVFRFFICVSDLLGFVVICEGVDGNIK